MSMQIQDIVVMEDLNYYNYFTEVEEAFVSRRGAPMLISPLDWALIESWKEMGIPLHIVLRGIMKSFDGFNPESNRGRRVNTLFYCQQEVLSNFRDYVDSQVGAGIGAASSTSSQPHNGNGTNHSNGSNGTNGSQDTNSNSDDSALFPKQELIDFINNRREELAQARQHAIAQRYNNLQEALWRAVTRLSELSSDLTHTRSVNAESLERDLTLLEEMIYESLRRDVPAAELEMIKQEAEQQLRPHKKRMEPAVYQQTLENYIAKRLREHNFISRLSLFYM